MTILYRGVNFCQKHNVFGMQWTRSAYVCGNELWIRVMIIRFDNVGRGEKHGKAGLCC